MDFFTEIVDLLAVVSPGQWISSRVNEKRNGIFGAFISSDGGACGTCVEEDAKLRAFSSFRVEFPLSFTN